MLGLVEPPLAASLQLERLRGLVAADGQRVTYACSRNRQWHVYTVMERKHRHSAALKRVFLRLGVGRGRGGVGQRQ